MSDRKSTVVVGILDRDLRQWGFPGLEPATDATMAQRRADAPLRPKVAQRACDVGLFSDERDQSDLVQQIARI